VQHYNSAELGFSTYTGAPELCIKWVPPFFWINLNNNNIVFLTPYFFLEFFSANDVALVLKYNFTTSGPSAACESDSYSSTSSTNAKKRKLIEPKRNESVLEYSSLKLPAAVFIDYLKTDVVHFLNSCQR